MIALPYTLRQLEYAVAIAETGGFRKAAEQCYVSQPSLSAQVAQLEEVLGVRLFERNRRRVLITSAGQELVSRAKQILTSAVDLQTAGARLSDPLRGQLKLGVIPTIAPYLLAEITPALRKQFPDLHILWTEDKTSSLRASLERGHLDAALLAIESDLGEVDHVEIARDRFVLAAAPSHPLARSRSRLPVTKLSNAYVFLLDDGHCFRDQVLDLCSKVGSAEADFRTTSLSTLVQLVASSGGLTLLPSLALPIENRNHDLNVRSLGAPVPYRTIALVWRPTSPLVESLELVAKAIRGAYPQSK